VENLQVTEALADILQHNKRLRGRHGLSRFRLSRRIMAFIPESFLWVVTKVFRKLATKTETSLK